MLHSLLGVKTDTEEAMYVFPKLAFTLPKTEVFLDIIRDSISKGDSTLLEPTFYLQLTQDEMPLDWIEEAVFNRDKDTRMNACGFLYLWVLQ